MTGAEIKNSLILASIFATRMLGLFMVLPILPLYVDKIPGATLPLLGLAVGVYGFTQALLQLPIGFLSDYCNRKWVIGGGLLVFAFGSMIAAYSDSIWGLIVGRAVQGAGAIGSPVLALVGDVTREQVRTRAMALIGISIGLTFVLAILLGPLLESITGLSGIFTITAVMATFGIALLFFLKTEAFSQKPAAFGEQLRCLFKPRDLWALNANIFVLHAMFTASFLVLPIKIQEITFLFSNQVWKFYLPVLGLSLLLVIPALRYADEPHWQSKLMKIAMVGLGLSILAFLFVWQLSTLVMAVTLFFVAFNFLEASLPALVSRIAPVASKGAAMGVYSCSQFLGIFSGGVLGGYLLQIGGHWAIGVGCLLLSAIGWLMLNRIGYLMTPRSELSTQT
ncbi:MAG: MFS transporter [Candidatus Berkiellales bacterium]